MRAYLDTDLTQILSDASFTQEQIDKVVRSGEDKASTSAQLWAQYFAVSHCNMEEFLTERGIKDLKLIEALITISQDVHSELHE